jgi:hypothetical protein
LSVGRGLELLGLCAEGHVEPAIFACGGEGADAVRRAFIILGWLVEKSDFSQRAAFSTSRTSNLSEMTVISPFPAKKGYVLAAAPLFSRANHGELR